eukprot:CAMPEP_0206240004 /NCGR_PEP_ID=MMETSP0047_2-20121206/15699_1 /ASSEMBLY_ACC=CAM_ASM_000192 /TAXON_ID=195065 /ORGANISM="Chroomonas mesostigmatica_cf, Strain CCMP1168" /LENGTH=499 /DNA_ID=CAMNT_0053664741 /DNA_START=42 /DNA_END=1542 /DNA_ORIENTATION=+
MGLFSSFDKIKCKTHLKLAMSRLALLKNKKATGVDRLRRQVAHMLTEKREEHARVRAEEVLREEGLTAGLEVLSGLCELLLARFSLLEGGGKECNEEILELVSTIIWSAPRAEVEELLVVSKELGHKYGKDFHRACTNNTENFANARIVSSLSYNTPSRAAVDDCLYSVARERNIPFIVEEPPLGASASALCSQTGWMSPPPQQQPATAEISLLGDTISPNPNGVSPDIYPDAELLSDGLLAGRLRELQEEAERERSERAAQEMQRARTEAMLQAKLDEMQAEMVRRQQELAELEAGKAEAMRVEKELLQKAAAAHEGRDKAEAELLRQIEESQRLREEREREQGELRARVEALQLSQEQGSVERQRVQEEKLKLEEEMKEGEKEREELLRVQAELQKSDAEMRERLAEVNANKARLEREMEELRVRMEAKEAAPAPMEPQPDEALTRVRLLEEYEGKRAELQKLQAAELERQERIVHELLESKKKKKEARLSSSVTKW